MPNLSRQEFVETARTCADHRRAIAIPVSLRLLSDQLTPVLAYRRLVAPDERTAPSFLLESVEGGERQGRYSILGSKPIIEVVSGTVPGKPVVVDIRDHRPHHHGRADLGHPEINRVTGSSDGHPLFTLRQISREFTLAVPPGPAGEALPKCFLGGWVGYAAYDTARSAEPKLRSSTPHDDRELPDLNFGFYDGVVVFDHVAKVVHLVHLAIIEPGADAASAFDRAVARLDAKAEEVQRHSKPLPAGRMERELPRRPLPSNLTREQHGAMVDRAKEYIRAGDIFQVVLGQRFERTSSADPFDVYRALRAVNPSPYMVYLQAEDCILVASSPEILCRVRAGTGGEGQQAGAPTYTVTNRPLAGTRRRGATPGEDAALEKELLADDKERAEHIMLVDLGRNDVGRVARPGSVALPALMEVERYSHVMHISSTVTGELREGLDCWDALVAALPVGTISGAPKVRAMQIIDELEPVKRGPYGGGMGCVGLDGQMDIALALRTIVVPTRLHSDSTWTYHLQASGGIVADSQAEAEYLETVNKAAALARAIDVAEQAFSEK